ncbi:MAG: tRNA-dihydrouridine synthase family protein [Candidatus Pacearchaeota archaeon]
MKYEIGNLKLKNRFLLAPMMEPNDIAFRILCEKAGCGLTYTGMTSPLSKKKINLEDRPAIQIFANSTEGIKSFIEKYDRKVKLWDLNLGCPSDISKKFAHGAFLKDVSKIENIIKVMRKSTKKPITIKLRKTKDSLKIAKIAEKYVDAIAIHPRTISQGYSGNPDYKLALKIKKLVSIPVIYSGNVNEKNVKDILKDFDFVFIGREAIGDCNIFSRITRINLNLNFDDYLKIAKENNLPFRQIKYQAMNFTKGLKNAKKIRKRIVGIKNIEEFEDKQIKTLFSL